MQAPPLSNGQIRDLCSRYERELRGAKDWMFWFLVLWTVVLLIMEWANFFVGREIPASMTAGYLVLLGAYIAHKEVLRWTNVNGKMRRGEIFVYAWWGMLLTMYLLGYTIGRWSVPEGMTVLCYEVLGFFALTEISKSLNARREKRQHES